MSRWNAEYQTHAARVVEAIKAMRLGMGVTMARISKLMGVEAQSYRMWERGGTLPSVTYLKKIEKFLNENLDAAAGPPAITEQQELVESLKAYRLSIEMKKGEFADKIGVPRGTYIEWELGNKFPQKNRLVQLESVLQGLLSAAVPEPVVPEETKQC